MPFIKWQEEGVGARWGSVQFICSNVSTVLFFNSKWGEFVLFARKLSLQDLGGRGAVSSCDTGGDTAGHQ